MFKKYFLFELAEEYLRGLSNKDETPATFDLFELKKQLMKISNGESFDRQLLDPGSEFRNFSLKSSSLTPSVVAHRWIDEMAAASTSRLASEWSEEYSRLSGRESLETIWENDDSEKVLQ